MKGFQNFQSKFKEELIKKKQKFYKNKIFIDNKTLDYFSVWDDIYKDTDKRVENQIKMVRKLF